MFQKHLPSYSYKSYSGTPKTVSQAVADAELALATGAGGSNPPPALPIPHTLPISPLDAVAQIIQNVNDNASSLATGAGVTIPITPLAETSPGTATTAGHKPKKDANGRVKKSSRWVQNDIKKSKSCTVNIKNNWNYAEHCPIR